MFTRFPEFGRSCDLAVFGWTDGRQWYLLGGRATATIADSEAVPRVNKRGDSWLALRFPIAIDQVRRIPRTLRLAHSLPRKLIPALPFDLVFVPANGQASSVGPNREHRVSVVPGSKSEALPCMSATVAGTNPLVYRARRELEEAISRSESFIDFETVTGALQLRQKVAENLEIGYFNFETEVPITFEIPRLEGTRAAIEGRGPHDLAPDSLRVKVAGEPRSEIQCPTVEVQVAEHSEARIRARADFESAPTRIKVQVLYKDFVVFEREATQTTAEVRRHASLEFTPTRTLAKPSPHAELVGAEVGERWLLKAGIGYGGYGDVYDAEHVVAGTPAAVKLIPQDEANDPEGLERFKREAKVGAQVRHPGIVRVYDAGFDEDCDSFYLAMERLEGGPLATLIGQRDKEDLLNYVADTLSALDKLHTYGVVHRDLKPSNLFVLDGDVHPKTKIIDFGLALLGGRERVTRTSGAPLGTIHYASPEQLHNPNDVDPRSDLWSVGVMLYEISTGRLPFDAGGDAPTILAIAKGEFVAARDRCVAEPLARVIDRCISAHPDDRYESALDLQDALREAIDACQRDGGT